MKTKTHFNGRHWETGSIHNALALQGIRAPHTGKPYSEALLLGISRAAPECDHVIDLLHK